MKLTQEQIEIIKNWNIKDNRFYLQWQLDRKQYLSINEILETIGLKWNKWKKAHIIEWFTQEQLEESINDVIETWEVETLKETIKKFQFYPTPKEVSEYLVSLANIKDWDIILEPSAWMWSILDAINKQDRNKLWTIVAIEIDSTRKEILEKKCDKLYIYDFLSHNKYWYDKIIMNPPFAKSQDVKHILHAYSLLSEWWTIVSIASSSIKTREWKLYDELRNLNPEFIELPDWSFKESWTMVNTVIVKIDKK